MKTDFFRQNKQKSDCDSFTRNWLRVSNLIPADPIKPTLLPNSNIDNSNSKWFGANAIKPTASFQHPIQPKSAVHTPQPITAQSIAQNGFTPINTDWQARGRENWASFSSNTAPVAINSVPVQIENQTNNSDLISL